MKNDLIFLLFFLAFYLDILVFSAVDINGTYFCNVTENTLIFLIIFRIFLLLSTVLAETASKLKSENQL